MNKYKEILPGVYNKRTDYKKVVLEALGFTLCVLLAYPLMVIITLAF